MQCLAPALLCQLCVINVAVNVMLVSSGPHTVHDEARGRLQEQLDRDSAPWTNEEISIAAVSMQTIHPDVFVVHDVVVEPDTQPGKDFSDGLSFSGCSETLGVSRSTPSFHYAIHVANSELVNKKKDSCIGCTAETSDC